MELIELETGLYLDIKIQELLKRILAIEPDQMLVKRTIILDSAYKIKLYNHNNMQFIQISNENIDYSIFVIMSKDFYNWKNELTNLKKRLFV